MSSVFDPRSRAGFGGCDRINRDDAIIDYVAHEFGLVRRASKEQWHFERTGRPVRDADAEH